MNYAFLHSVFRIISDFKFRKLIVTFFKKVIPRIFVDDHVIYEILIVNGSFAKLFTVTFV